MTGSNSVSRTEKGYVDTETRGAIAALGETMNAGFARMGARMDAGFARVDDRFARVDRYFELQQAQHLALRGEFAELRVEVRELRDRVDVLTDRVGRLEHEVSQLRDYVTREVAEIRLDLRVLKERPGQTVELRREIAELAVRVDRLEQRQSD